MQTESSPPSVLYGMSVGAPPELTRETVSPEVKSLLDASMSQAPVTGRLQLPDDLKNAVAEEAPKEPERLHVPVPEQWDITKTKDPVDEEPWDVWKTELGALRAEVTEEDKTIFLKGVMNDKDVVFPVDMHGHVVNIISLGNENLRVLAHAMMLDFRSKILKDVSMYSTRLQYHAVMLQFRGIDGICGGFIPDNVLNDKWGRLERLGHFLFFRNTRIKRLGWWLHHNSGVHMGSVSGPRYALMVQAIRVFEMKFARCKEGLANGDFFARAEPSS